VFINCPFDLEYAPMFEALVFAIFACGFRPRSALEIDDSGQARIEKIYNIIEQCRYGVHDLCRTEPDPKHGLPRFNMPLELGLFLGAKRYGDEHQKQKRCVIFDLEPFRYQRFISDLAGMDIHVHGGDPRAAVEHTRDWLANVSRRKLPGAALILKLYDEFAAGRDRLVEELGFAGRRIPYIDFERLVTAWLMETPQRSATRRSRRKTKG